MSQSLQPDAPPGTVQCQITGKWVPEDETVIIQGLRVSAEGKAELLERLRSGETPPGVMMAPSVLRRFCGIVIDLVVLFGASAFVDVLFLDSNEIVPPDPYTADFTSVIEAALASQTPAQGVWAMISSSIIFIYFMLLHKHFGQTLGKLICSMRVVKADGTPISTQQAIMRTFFFFLAFILLGNILGGIAILTRSTPLYLICAAVTFLALLYGLAEVIVALADPGQQRSLHDRIAGTRVIHVER